MTLFARVLQLAAHRVVDAATLPLAYRTLPPEQTLEGTARVGVAELGRDGGCVLGVWEISPSVSTDVECDEVFVVLSGEAEVRFDDGMPPLRLRPGSVARFVDGAATTWLVRETLRKVYLARSSLDTLINDTP